MAGFGVDEVALQGAIDKLETIKGDISKVVRRASGLSPGELTAGDVATNRARTAIQGRATSDAGSLRMVAEGLQTKLQEKIDAYKATLQEYRLAEDNATVDADRINRQA